MVVEGVRTDAGASPSWNNDIINICVEYVQMPGQSPAGTMILEFGLGPTIRQDHAFLFVFFLCFVCVSLFLMRWHYGCPMTGTRNA